MGRHLLWRKIVISLFFSTIIASTAFSPCIFASTTAKKNILNVSKTQTSSASSKSGLEKSDKYIEIDLAGAEREEVTPYRKEFLKPFGQKKLALILEEGENYRLYVRAKLKEMNMPSAIEYLPVIESEYIPSARSKDGKGVGMWQFMMNSIEPFLTVNEWIDERLDPWKETDAALQKLQDNYKMFGDWLLAIAAYNCGAGAMKRALAALNATDALSAENALPSANAEDKQMQVNKTKEKSFWAVAKTSFIPEHTKRYIPKLIAIADLCENTKYYGINLPTAKDENGNPVNPHCAEFDYVQTNTAVALRFLSGELRIDLKILEELNPALIYGITPPDQSYSLRLPSGMKEAAQIYIKNNR